MSWDTAIQVGGSLLGGLLGRNRNKSADHWNNVAQRNYETQIQTRVADAKAAGIHPLYALGSQGASPSFQAGDTGSAIGSGIARASEALGAGLSQRQARNAQAPLLAAEVRRANADAELSEVRAASERKRLEMEVNHRRPDPLLAVHAGQEPVVRRPGAEPTADITNPESIYIPGWGEWYPGPQSSAQAVEDYGGDLFGSVYGAASVLSDVGPNVGIKAHDVGKPYFRELLGKIARWWKSSYRDKADRRWKARARFNSTHPLARLRAARRRLEDWKP